MMIIKRSISVIILILFSIVGYANNLIVSNAERLNAGGARDEITFSISWENSWNVSGAPANYDAAWIFIKFRECGNTNVWNHAKLITTSGASGSASASGHTLGSDIVFATDILTTDRRGLATHGEHNTGVMIRRSTIGIGDITAQVCTLKVLGTAVNGVLLDPAKEYDIKVFGIEMVQIPEGPYYLGDGTSRGRISDQSNDNLPLFINAGEEVSYNFRGNNDWYGNTRLNWTVPDSVAVGYQEFFCMKYEISQGQYVDFLNTINVAQQSARFASRNNNGTHFALSNGVAVSNYPNRAISWSSPADHFTYLDWACLRPMSELEYEKVCRGPKYPVAFENAWGESTATGLVDAETINYPAEGQMTAVEIEANLNMNGGGAVTNYPGPGPEGVMDVGIFAREGGETRRSSGATYYGVMEMAGNAADLCLNMATLRNVWIGDWGNGQVSVLGMYDVPSWLLAENINGNSDYTLIGKGGYWDLNYNHDPYSYYVSWRDWTGTGYEIRDARNIDRQIRGIR